MITKAALKIIWFYRAAISPYLPSTCIYQPTCSSYTAEAITTHGLARGLWMGTKRLGRCTPFHTGGIDLVPIPDELNQESPAIPEVTTR